MKKVSVIFLLFCVPFLLRCSSTPTVSDARKVFENMQFNFLADDSIRIVSFEKINAQKGELTGIKFYKIEYQVEIEFLTEMWEGNIGLPKKFIYSIPEVGARKKLTDALIKERKEREEIERLKLEYALLENPESIRLLKALVDHHQRVLDSLSADPAKYKAPFKPLTERDIEVLSKLGITLHHPGERKKLEGTLTFDKTENGWRAEDGNIY
jgi:hypothetical protein